MIEAVERPHSQEAKLSEHVGLGGLDDGEAQALADKVVREVRREVGRKPAEGPAPSPEEVRAKIFSSRSRDKND